MIYYELVSEISKKILFIPLRKKFEDFCIELEKIKDDNSNLGLVSRITEDNSLLLLYMFQLDITLYNDISHYYLMTKNCEYYQDVTQLKLYVDKLDKDTQHELFPSSMFSVSKNNGGAL